MFENIKLMRFATLNTLFKGMEKPQIKNIIKAKMLKTFEEGTFIYQQNEDASCLYLITEGEVKIKYSDGGKGEQKFLLDFFGEKEIIENSKRNSAAIAEKKCILYEIPLKELKILIQQNPFIKKNLIAANNARKENNQPKEFEKAFPTTSNKINF
jgi:signal-transduction protein with cAMP-binding, CBS, and nucleotidyltransferase domain